MSPHNALRFWQAVKYFRMDQKFIFESIGHNLNRKMIFESIDKLFWGLRQSQQVQGKARGRARRSMEA